MRYYTSLYSIWLANKQIIVTGNEISVLTSTCPNVWSEIKQIRGISTSLNLWIAVARDYFKWAKMYKIYLSALKVNII